MSNTSTKCRAKEPSSCRYHGSPFINENPERITQSIATVQASLDLDLYFYGSLDWKQKTTKVARDLEAQITGHKMKILELQTAYNLTDVGYQQLQNRVQGFKNHPAATKARYEEEKRKLELVEKLKTIKEENEKLFKEERETIRKDKNLSKEEKTTQIYAAQRRLMNRITSAKIDSQKELSAKADKENLSMKEYINQLNMSGMGFEHLLTQARTWKF